MDKKSAYTYMKLYDIIAGIVYCILLVLLVVQRFIYEGEPQIPTSFLFILITFGLLYLYGINKALKSNYSEYESPKIRIIIIRVAIFLLSVFAAIKLLTLYLST
ncbi:MAG TPA: hypothetical protein VGE40_08305 [Bacilli bacterium]